MRVCEKIWKMLKHVQSLGGEARTGLQSCTSPPPLPPRFDSFLYFTKYGGNCYNVILIQISATLAYLTIFIYLIKYGGYCHIVFKLIRVGTTFATKIWLSFSTSSTMYETKYLPPLSLGLDSFPHHIKIAEFLALVIISLKLYKNQFFEQGWKSP